MHPTRAASLLAALGALLIAAALLLRALSLGQAFASPGQSGSIPRQFLPALGGYRFAPDGQSISFILAPPTAPRTQVNWYSMPVNGGLVVSGTAPATDLRPFQVASGQAFVISGEGGTLQLGSPPDEQVREARLSPDARALAFATNTPSGKSRLYILHDSNRLEWLGEEETIIDLDWSPDGQMLAFLATRDLVDQVFVVSTDGQVYRQLTSDAARKSRPRWSPDSTTLAYLAVEGGYSATIGLATPTAPAVILAPTLTPAAGAEPPAPARADIYLVGADGANQRRLTDTPEEETALAWLQSRRGAEIAFAVRSAEHPQVSYLYAVEPAGGALRRVYPTTLLEALECPPSIAEGVPAVARITVSNSALVQQDLPVVLRARSLPMQPFENIPSAVVRSETLTLLPGETRVLEWPVAASSGRTTYLSAVASTDPRLPISEQHCSAPNTYLGLPRLPFLAISLPLLILGMLLCVPRLLQIRRKLFWAVWAAALLGFWLVFAVEAALA